MPALALHTVEYNGVVLGAVAAAPRTILEGQFRYNRSATTGRFEFEQDFVLYDSVQATFLAQALDLEAKLSTANKKLALTWESGAYITHDPAAAVASGLLNRASCVKTGEGRYMGARCRRYRLRVEGFTPASAFHGDTSTHGFVEGNIKLGFDSTGRPLYTFTGTYTAEANKTANENFTDGTYGGQARADAYLDSRSTPYGPSSAYEIVRTEAVDEDQGKRLTYTIEMRYRIVPVIDTAVGNARRFTIDSLEIGRGRAERIGVPGPELSNAGGAQAAANAYRTAPAGGGVVGGGGDRPPAVFTLRALVKLNLNFSDSTYTKHAEIYESLIRPYLRSLLITEWSPSRNAADRPGGNDYFSQEDVSPTPDANTFIVSWKVQTTNANGFVSLIHRTITRYDLRIRDRKLADGQDHTWDSQSAGIAQRLETTTRGLFVGAGPLSRDEIASKAPQPSDARYKLRGASIEGESFLAVGPGDTTVVLTEFEVTRNFLFVLPSSGGGAAPSDRVITPNQNDVGGAIEGALGRA